MLRTADSCQAPKTYALPRGIAHTNAVSRVRLHLHTFHQLYKNTNRALSSFRRQLPTAEEMEIPATADACKVCSTTVTQRQHAMECDRCHSWIHRLCGTGVSYLQYRGMMENAQRGVPFEWTCPQCVAKQRRSTVSDIGEPQCDSTHVDDASPSPYV